MFIFNDTILKIFTLGIGQGRFIGITLFPFVFAAKSQKNNTIFINHESIHIRQQLETLVIFFYLIYGISFIINLIKFKNWMAAYSMICFEREAYAKQGTIGYLKTRKFWSFVKYMNINRLNIG